VATKTRSKLDGISFLEVALALYWQIMPTLVEQTNNTAYIEAIKLVRRIERILSGPERKREYVAKRFNPLYPNRNSPLPQALSYMLD
jgi:hypothetical protein